MPFADQSVPDAGDVLWIDFGAPVGHEQGGRRPALVLTSQAYNRASSVLLVSPISRTRRDWPFQVELTGVEPLTGFILADQVRVIDPSLRRLRHAGKAGDTTMAEVRGVLATLFGIPVAT